MAVQYEIFVKHKESDMILAKDVQFTLGKAFRRAIDMIWENGIFGTYARIFCTTESGVRLWVETVYAN
jgi:hypothetical protein